MGEHENRPLLIGRASLVFTQQTKMCLPLHIQFLFSCNPILVLAVVLLCAHFGLPFRLQFLARSAY